MPHTKQRSNEEEDWTGLEALAKAAVDCGFKVHDRLGPGLLESAYEMIFFEALQRRGLRVERQIPISIVVDDIRVIDAFRADLLVEGQLLIELKSVETISPVHFKQVQTYLRLMGLPLGLLMNFGAATFQSGCKRIINSRIGFVSSFQSGKRSEISMSGDSCDEPRA
jgi:GxxExxY protein